MRRRIMVLMMVFVALAHFNRISISVVGAEKLIRKDFINETEMGLVYSAYLLLYTLFMMPGGWFIDRFGPRRSWMVVAFGSALFVALTGVAGLLWTQAMALWAVLLVVRALLGIVSAPLHPTAARLVGNWYPPSGASLANGLVTGAACAGMASTYLLFGWLMDEVGWPGAFLACSAVTLLVAFVWSLLARDHPRETTKAIHQPSARPGPGEFLKLLRNRSLLCLTLSYAAYGYFQYLFFYWAQYYFEKVQEVPKETSRVYTSILILAMGAGMVLGGGLSDRAARRFGVRCGLAVTPILGLLVSALAVGAGLNAGSPRNVFLCFTVAMAFAGMVEGSAWTAAVLVGGTRGGTAASIMNTGGNAGGLLAPVLTPLISRFLGWQAGLGLACGVCVAGAALWLAIDPAKRLE